MAATLPKLTSKIDPVLVYLESLKERADLVVLNKLLEASGATADDVKEHCIFHDNHYSRNKVAGSDWFDFYVMCWKPNQASTIHDHQNSSCAFRILEGTATEVVYDLKDGYVYPIRSRTYSFGEICAAQDGEIHKITNESSNDNLITLHIYSPPLQMSCYEVAPGVVDSIES